jgi:DNA-binding MarR family transcriptional regulator
MIKKAHELVFVWQHIDEHRELSPRQIAYLCVFANGELLGASAVAERMNVLRDKAANQVHILSGRGFVESAGRGRFILTKKGLNLIEELFPFTYVK